MAKKKKRKAILPDYGDDWAGIFYITDLNDGTYYYRKEDPRPWYNVRIRPNSISNDSRHYCIACGSDYDAMLRTISLYVSTYKSPADMFFELKSQLYDGFKQGKRMLEIEDDYWDEFCDDECISQYDEDILDAIEQGRKTVILGNSFDNVKVKYTESEEDYLIEGRWAEWFEDFVDKIMNFDGHTKKEFYYTINDDCDVYCTNEIFYGLMDIGVKGIKGMKKLSVYRWFDVLVPIVNSWNTEYDE